MTDLLLRLLMTDHVIEDWFMCMAIARLRDSQVLERLALKRSAANMSEEDKEQAASHVDLKKKRKFHDVYLELPKNEKRRKKFAAEQMAVFMSSVKEHTCRAQTCMINVSGAYFFCPFTGHMHVCTPSECSFSAARELEAPACPFSGIGDSSMRLDPAENVAADKKVAGEYSFSCDPKPRPRGKVFVSDTTTQLVTAARTILDRTSLSRVEQNKLLERLQRRWIEWKDAPFECLEAFAFAFLRDELYQENIERPTNCRDSELGRVLDFLHPERVQISEKTKQTMTTAEQLHSLRIDSRSRSGLDLL